MYISRRLGQNSTGPKGSARPLLRGQDVPRRSHLQSRNVGLVQSELESGCPGSANRRLPSGLRQRRTKHVRSFLALPPLAIKAVLHLRLFRLSPGEAKAKRHIIAASRSQKRTGEGGRRSDEHNVMWGGVARRLKFCTQAVRQAMQCNVIPRRTSLTLMRGKMRPGVLAKERSSERTVGANVSLFWNMSSAISYLVLRCSSFAWSCNPQW